MQNESEPDSLHPARPRLGSVSWQCVVVQTEPVTSGRGGRAGAKYCISVHTNPRLSDTPIDILNI